ncbi:MAG TPA: endonuclease V [Pseudonocardiaceae bacterium]
MQLRSLGRWPTTIEDAAAVQDELRALVDTVGPGPRALGTAAGVDVAYQRDGDRVAAAAVVLDTETLLPVETAIAIGRAGFEYASGFLAFRELPAISTVLEQLTTVPDVLVCDGQGLAHPRRFGLACHVGVLTGVPTIGVAKTPPGPFEPPAAERGAWTPLLDGGEVVGRALRTQDGVKPVFVSVGHKVDLETACAHVLRLSPRYRLPETTRQADRLARDTALR